MMHPFLGIRTRELLRAVAFELIDEDPSARVVTREGREDQTGAQRRL